ncbi:MAG TPA: apolipoprotein acyltransferase, partial [Cystobacter sp.]
MSGEDGSRRLPVLLPWLALVGGAGMSMLLNSRGSLLPGWLMGALLLFFVRQQRPGVGFVGILCVNTLATGLTNLEVFPGSVAGNFGMAFGGAL